MRKKVVQIRNYIYIRSSNVIAKIYPKDILPNKIFIICLINKADILTNTNADSLERESEKEKDLCRTLNKIISKKKKLLNLFFLKYI